MADYDFSKAENIISIDADFLSDWQGGGSSSGYTKTRIPDKSQNKTMSYHIQFESNMSLTGSNADDRVPAKPSENTRFSKSIRQSKHQSNLGGKRRIWFC